jgi:hypothetical protein
LEEEMGGVGLEGQIAQLVDDQQFGPRQGCQLLVERTVIVRLASIATNVAAVTNCTE